MSAQSLISRLDLQAAGNEAIRINKVSVDQVRDIVGYDEAGTRIGGLRFSKLTSEGVKNVELFVPNSSNGAQSFLRARNISTGEYLDLFKNVLVQAGSLFLGNSADANKRFGCVAVSSSADVTAIQRYIVGSLTEGPEFDKLLADMNNDGTISIIDATLIQISISKK